MGFFLSASCAFAASQLPSNENAGAEQQRFRRETEIKDTLTRIEKNAPDDENVVSGSEGEETAVGGKEFQLKSVRFTGNRKILSRDLDVLAHGWIGQSVTLADLKNLASRVKKHYRDHGFVAAYVYLPPQDVSEGTVEITVIEGRLGKLRVEGNRFYSSEILRQAAGLRDGDVIYASTLNSGLSYLNANPDLKAKALLNPGEEPQTTDVILRVEDRSPFHLSADVNNLGTRNTGITRWGTSLSYNNLTGHMDKLGGRYQGGKGAWALGGDYTYPIRPNSTELSLSASYSEIDLVGDFAALDVEGQAATVGAGVKQRVWTNAFFDTFLTAGFEAKDVSNSILGQEAGHDELRIPSAGFEINETDAWGRTYSPHSFHFGVSDFLGSSKKEDPQASRAGSGGQFFVYRGALVRYQRLPWWGATYSLRGSLQLTSDRLPSSEQFRLGGAFSVRGYAEGDYLADSGGQISNEIYIPAYIFPKDWRLPNAKEPLQQQVQWVGFYDFGAGSLRSARPGEDHTRSLAGAGLGLRIHLYDKVFGRLQWAARTGPRGNDGSHSVFYYGISSEIF